MGEEKEVKKTLKEVKKTSLLDLVFLSIQAGKETKQICKDMGFSKQRLQYYLNKLKKEGRIQKIGYATWQEVKGEVGRSVRGHGFVWHIKLPKTINNFPQVLSKKKIKYKLINNNHTCQFFFKENRVWASKDSIVIWDIKSYFGFTSIDSKRYAMSELQSFLRALEGSTGIDFKFKGNYILKTSRNHFALVRNALAMQCRKDNTKINVYNERGLWFIIDNSFNLEEAETIHPKEALLDNLGVQKYFNEHKETGWVWTPKSISKAIGDIVQVQQMNAENIVKHQKVLDEMLITLKSIRDNLQLLSENKSI